MQVSLGNEKISGLKEAVRGVGDLDLISLSGLFIVFCKKQARWWEDVEDGGIVPKCSCPKVASYL